MVSITQAGLQKSYKEKSRADLIPFLTQDDPS